MSQKFRKVDPRAWTDEKFRALDSNGKLLALWMLTGSRVNRCGIVLWSPGLASEETGIALNSIDSVCDTVCDTLSWFRHIPSHTVFLRRWWRYNRPDNVKALIGFLSDLHDVPTNGLRDALIEAAQDLPSTFHTVYLKALGVGDTVSDTVSPQEKEKEKEKEKGGHGGGSRPPAPRTPRPPGPLSRRGRGRGNRGAPDVQCPRLRDLTDDAPAWALETHRRLTAREPVSDEAADALIAWRQGGQPPEPNLTPEEARV